MDKNNKYLVIPAGGLGRRTFGFATEEDPKQFNPSPPDGDRTFIQETVKRGMLIGIHPSHIIIVVTNENQREIAKSQTLKEGIISSNIVIFDPELGYAGCMIKAAMMIYEKNPEAIVFNFPSDQYIDPDEEFYAAIEDAAYAAKNGYAAIVGVRINDRVTVSGCGNVLYDEDSTGPCYNIKEFKEKPNYKEAEKLINQGNSVINTGINVWPAKLIVDKFSDEDYFGIETDKLMDAFGPALKVSIGNFKWFDCGTLDSLYKVSRKSPNHKNARMGDGNIEYFGCRRSFFFATEGVNLHVTGATDDAITVRSINERLVINIVKLANSQEVKELANDFYDHDGVLTKNKFLYGKNRNNVLKSNIPEDDIVVGFLGVRNYAVIAYRETNGDVTVFVSQQLEKE